MPVLLYHLVVPKRTALNVSGRGDLTEVVTLTEFKEHLRWFRSLGFTSILFDDYFSKPNAWKELPERAFAITFDDGNESDYSIALPMLLDFGYRANFFLTVSSIGSSGFLTWEKVLEMKNLGMSIQSHTLTHPFLTELRESELQRELFQSKDQLEQHLGSPVEFLSIPGGFYNKRVKNLSRQAGYKAICTSKFGLNAFNRKSFTIERITMRQGRCPDQISKLLNPYSVESLRLQGKMTGLQVVKYFLGASSTTTLSFS